MTISATAERAAPTPFMFDRMATDNWFFRVGLVSGETLIACEMVGTSSFAGETWIDLRLSQQQGNDGGKDGTICTDPDRETVTVRASSIAYIQDCGRS